jgi:hypothetical protein
MVNPQVADRGDSLQIKRIAVNILNKQLQTAKKGSNFGFACGPNKSST